MYGHPFALHPVIALAVTGVAPPSAAEQEQHNKNNQNGLHVRTSLVGGGGVIFVTVASLPHCATC
jgi:hypothetical protein